MAVETPRPQRGTWTLTAPDGRYWQGMTPIAACGAELRERVPAHVAVQRIMEMVDEEPLSDEAIEETLNKLYSAARATGALNGGMVGVQWNHLIARHFYELAQGAAA